MPISSKERHPTKGVKRRRNVAKESARRKRENRVWGGGLDEEQKSGPKGRGGSRGWPVGA